MDSVNYLTFDGISFGETRADAIVATGGHDNAMVSCNFAFVGNHAVTISGGTRTSVQGCTMHDIGAGAVVLDGGRPAESDAGRAPPRATTSSATAW